MNGFSATLLNWYHQHKRDLPWRSTRDPYLIWLSEVILQQTRVDQGLAYYQRFSTNFPTVSHLAKAPEDNVMKLWQGLGYYSRARNLHAAAKTIHEKFKGKFPDNYKDIRALKGVGDYTAGAIASFAFGLPYPVVDGNVYRVLSRIFGIKTPIDSTLGKKQFMELAAELLDKKDPAAFNQAIMEFGAIQCKPQNPDCVVCPFSHNCFAFSKKQVKSLPVKEKKTRQRQRYFHYLVIHYKGKTVLHKRTAKDIWINLYEFPLIESDVDWDETNLLNSTEWKKLFGKSAWTLKKVSEQVKHVLSHQQLFTRFYEVEVSEAMMKNLQQDYLVIARKDLVHYALPRLIDKYLHS